jgi:6-phosphogluconolactonase (cycloisomerase 2 family)
VFVQSNDPTKNEVVAFGRNVEKGTLQEIGRYDTGGTGSGSFEDTAEGVVLGTPAGEAGPQHYIDGAQLLFVTNAGSNSVSVFRVNADGLELVDTVPSGGEKPVSITVNQGLLYVLNSGELDDRFILSFEQLQFLDNCTHGDQPTVTGFRIANDGKLTAIEDSTRPLSGGQESGCSQVSFSPDGETLLVSERLSTLPQREPNKGAIVTFAVNDDGTLGAKQVQDTSGVGPFGFGFSPDGTLLVTEQNHAEEQKGAVSSYTLLEDGKLKPISKAVDNQQTDTCWVVTTADGRLAFASSALASGSISSYRVDESGSLTLLEGSATAEPGDAKNTHLKNGTTDLSLSRDSKFLYQLNSHFGTMQVFRVNDNGHLSFVEEQKVFDVTLPEDGGQLTPFGIAAF